MCVCVYIMHIYVQRVYTPPPPPLIKLQALPVRYMFIYRERKIEREMLARVPLDSPLRNCATFRNCVTLVSLG